MDSAKLAGSGRADSSPCHSRENGNPGGLTKDRVTQSRRMRTIPTCHCGEACPGEGRESQSRKRALEAVCLFVLDARLIGRFPLMPLAWIPAYAGIVHVPWDTTKDESASVRVAQARADTGTFMAIAHVPLALGHHQG